MILSWARQVPSPNCSSREGCAVDTIVLHHISLPPGTFGGGPYIEAFFLNRLDPAVHPYFAEIAHLRVSAHFFVDRRGEVTQFVDTEHKAWHAGESSFGGCCDVNRFSVGIELEGDEETPYEGVQYQSLTGVVRAVLKAHPEITPERIVGHEHVAPGRKRDPGPLFEWEVLRSSLRAGG